jgi:hypothetical protein
MRKIGNIKKPVFRVLRSSSQPPPKGGGGTFGAKYLKVGKPPANRLGRTISLGGICDAFFKNSVAPRRCQSAAPRFVAVFNEEHRSTGHLTQKHLHHAHRGRSKGGAGGVGVGGWMGGSDVSLRQTYVSYLGEFVNMWLNPRLRPKRRTRTKLLAVQLGERASESKEASAEGGGQAVRKGVGGWDSEKQVLVEEEEEKEEESAEARRLEILKSRAPN